MAASVPRLTYLRIKNYRALRDVEFRDLTPLTVFIGPNGSGKSTVLDALDFLAEAVRGNLVQAWEKRNRFEGMRTKRSEGNIRLELCFKRSVQSNLIYFLEIAQHKNGRLFVMEERLQITYGVEIETVFFQELRGNYERFGLVSKVFKSESDNQDNWHFSSDSAFTSTVVLTDSQENWAHILLNNEMLLLGGAGEISTTLLNIIASYRLAHLTDDHLKGYSDTGPRERLSLNGDNLPNVLYYLHLRHPEVLARITAKLKSWVPKLADVVPEITSDKRILLRFRDTPGEEPLPARYMSGGTMRLVALLTLLYEPDATRLLGIEEPENELHPQLLHRLAEELGKATEQRQLLVTTHSPFLLDALAPEQVWILHRGSDGYTQATRAADLPNVKELVEDGSPLGYLWTSNSLASADPLTPAADAR